MEINVSQQQARVPVTIFSITGEIDAESYEQLEAQVQQAMGAGTRHLLLDLSQVPYISSYGIRGISEIFTWLRDRSEGEDDAALSQGLRDGKFKSQHLKLSGASPQVEKVLKMAGIDMFLEMHRNTKEAVASF